jgi:hypothetical protein
VQPSRSSSAASGGSTASVLTRVTAALDALTAVTRELYGFASSSKPASGRDRAPSAGSLAGPWAAVDSDDDVVKVMVSVPISRPVQPPTVELVLATSCVYVEPSDAPLPQSVTDEVQRLQVRRHDCHCHCHCGAADRVLCVSRSIMWKL